MVYSKMKRIMFFPLFLATLFLYAQACGIDRPAGEADGGDTTAVVPAPADSVSSLRTGIDTKAWQVAKPEQLGYSSEGFAALTKRLDSLDVSHFVVVVDGRIIFTYGDYDRNTYYIASCRKSILAMMYGKWVENGTIDLDKTVGDLGMDDIGGLLPIEKKATIRHLLTARSGCYHPASNTGDDTAYAPERGSVEPGTYFLYNNWDFNAAGYVFELLTGKDIFRDFYDQFANPLGMQDFLLSSHKHAGNLDLSIYPTYHFRLTARDMARIGLLMLYDGEWMGKRLISHEWIQTITSPVTPRAEMHPDSRKTGSFDYGYLWWIYSPEKKNFKADIFGGGYSAMGSGGQRITVLPAMNMVVVQKVKEGSVGTATYNSLIEQVAGCKL